MKLYEHPDFEQAILRAAEHFRGRGLRPAVIEKDYYVTEALRISSRLRNLPQSSGWNMTGNARCFVMGSIHPGKKFRLVC